MVLASPGEIGRGWKCSCAHTSESTKRRKFGPKCANDADVPCSRIPHSCPFPVSEQIRERQSVPQYPGNLHDKLSHSLLLVGSCYDPLFLSSVLSPSQWALPFLAFISIFGTFFGGGGGTGFPDIVRPGHTSFYPRVFEIEIFKGRPEKFFVLLFLV
ncbi:hypothetical protein CDAR_527301 [Caerostris darwini]|uniref:Uncharacterized protein n=1 Tax=Caerostris darwini TaxID=1538125 RepID=A0AAV4WJ81_9ARAC|nr:hypothetical protein CDAR_527301 [Caerostris darwini]